MSKDEAAHTQKTESIRVEKPLKKETVRVQAIRVYVPELNAEVNSTTERNEEPALLVKSTKRMKTSHLEIELVFLGSAKDRHVEKLGYYKKPPESWVSWGEIVLSFEEALRLAQVLMYVTLTSIVDVFHAIIAHGDRKNESERS